MTIYTLSVRNESLNATRFAVFQEKPELDVGSNVFTLAWFSKYAYQGTQAEFGWAINYSAIWSRPGQELRTGVVCKSSQTKAVDLNGPNTVTLGYDKENDAFDFSQVTEGKSGSIYTNCNDSVPHSSASPSAAAGVGIGMSGAGTFLVQTQPNINLTWTPKPKYFLVAGSFKSGEILDVQTIMNAGRALEIPYKGITSQSAYLDENNQLHLG
ncbi:hypothetical protein OE749_16695 [Aestuariibacter sp. AA17]|uniref:Protein rhiA n=1 Tax=Fluctibacter corallii TaxID=2984329 RepID=A0ABT3ACD4_9ALTE|nr:hypothetical protein [Aestuariibacter sp. AA17]MCV2886335.1 hypothetical protein [Aestuariibacter sp. AA17]